MRTHGKERDECGTADGGAENCGEVGGNDERGYSVEGGYVGKVGRSYRTVGVADKVGQRSDNRYRNYDGNRQRFKVGGDAVGIEPSFETDEFFNAALRSSYERLIKECDGAKSVNSGSNDGEEKGDGQ